MNVAQITMPREQVAAKLAAYREQLRKRGDAEYEAALAGYQALAEGTPLISLTEAIRAGGFDDKMRPRLAVARADRRQVHFFWPMRGTQARFSSNLNAAWGRQWPSLVLTVDMGREHGYQEVTRWSGQRPVPRDVEGFALVPLVPADVRPAGDLKGHLVLWEVEQWADRRIGAAPDRDPYLLSHLGGDLYAVVAEWELTELERLVMAGRRDG